MNTKNQTSQLVIGKNERFKKKKKKKKKKERKKERKKEKRNFPGLYACQNVFILHISTT